MKLRNWIGPGSMVTAAFIGPGTLTVCTLAGAEWGYSLLWVLVFATLATIVLQEMAMRLGLVYGRGLAEAIRSELRSPMLRGLGVSLVFLAIILGNAAYEAGNLTGASLGLQSFANPDLPYPLLLGLLVAVLLWVGSYRLLQGLLTFAVLAMSVVFVTTAMLLPHPISDLINGFVPRIHADNQWMVMALIGTTIVPYNLFLHASLVQRRWIDKSQLSAARQESVRAILVGGIISIGVLLTATGVMGRSIEGVGDMAEQLTPVLGAFARPFLATGLLAAGLTSAITAPLAAALTAQGLFGWKSTGWRVRLVWMTVVATGVIFSSLDLKPLRLIQVAQMTNGLLLPLIVGFLIFMCNRHAVMSEHTNSRWQNVKGILVWGIATLVGFRALAGVLGWW